MKIIKYCAIVLLIAFAATGCKKQDQPIKPIQSATFTAVVEDPSALFPPTQTITNINIIAGTNGWSITQNPTNTWCITEKNFGAGDFKLKLTINANATGLDRTTQIKLVSTNASLAPVLLNIKQSK
ncbi:BACON domain-containing protein [Pedobacter arcticus]|uniref:BACON domain-containing protein n=1 Tax=Pedobacter arcticus TaxID=752140 RepID=UPI0002FE6191|nr:BACON domain-containing carbohydrate-binding protein [Pedobacter arcticus]